MTRCSRCRTAEGPGKWIPCSPANCDDPRIIPCWYCDVCYQIEVQEMGGSHIAVLEEAKAQSFIGIIDLLGWKPIEQWAIECDPTHRYEFVLPWHIRDTTDPEVQPIYSLVRANTHIKQRPDWSHV